MTDLSFICGEVRALESKLLGVNQLSRMIEAPTPEDAFRVLVELQYSEYFDESTTVKDFDRIIEQGLLETKQLLENGSQNHPGLQFLWRRFDLNNLKQAAKQRFITHQKHLGEFTEENGFSQLGSLTESDLQKSFFEGKISGDWSPEFRRVVAEIEDILQKNEKNFRLVEFALDQAYFSICSQIAEEANPEFLLDLLSFWVDSANFRNLVRALLIGGEKLPTEAVISGGELSVGDVTKIEEVSGLEKLAPRTKFGSTTSVFLEDIEPEEKMLKIEKIIDQQYLDFLEKSALGGAIDIAVPFGYFEKRLRNARMIKFVMAAKFHGIDSEAIYEALKSY